MIAQFLVNGFVSGCLYSIIGIGFGLIYNSTKIFHIAYGATFTFGAYMLYTFYRICNFNLFFSLLFSLIFSSILVIIIESFVYFPWGRNPLYKKQTPSAIALIASLGMYIFIINFIAMIYGNETKVLRPGIEKTYSIGNIILTRIQVAEIIAFLIVFLLFYIFINKTMMGKIIKAIANNPELAEVIGIDIKKIRLVIFIIGTAICVLGASLQALDVGIDPNIGMPAILISAVVVIISGVGNFISAPVGGLLLGITQNLVVWKISARWEYPIVFIILIIFLLLRPQGLLGIAKRIEEMQ